MQKVMLTANFDDDEDGVVDDADLFEEIVVPSTNIVSKYIIFKKVTSADGVEDYNYNDNSMSTVIILNTKSELRPFSEYSDGQVFKIPLYPCSKCRI